MTCMGHSTLVWVGMSTVERQNGGLKNWYFFCAKLRSKELKIFNISRAKELKFEPNLSRAENMINFWHSLVGAKISSLSHKMGSKYLNHAATGDLKSLYSAFAFYTWFSFASVFKMYWNGLWNNFLHFWGSYLNCGHV